MVILFPVTMGQVILCQIRMAVREILQSFVGYEWSSCRVVVPDLREEQRKEDDGNKQARWVVMMLLLLIVIVFWKGVRMSECQNCPDGRF